MCCNDDQTVEHSKKTELVLLGIDDTGYDGYKIVSFVFGHTYQPRLQLSRCFIYMRISASYTEPTSNYCSMPNLPF